MAFRVNMKPTSVIKARLGINPDGDVQKMFTHTCRVHMDKYVPMKDGDLPSKVNEGKNYVHYLSPYAHYMYEGRVMGPNVPIKRDGIIVGWFSPIKPKYYTGEDIIYSTTKHPLASSHWDKKMWSAEKEQVIREVQNYMRSR